MIWAASSLMGPLKVCFVPKMISSHYQFVMRRAILPFWRRNRLGNYNCMQDNVPIHISQSSKAWFQRKNIPLPTGLQIAPTLIQWKTFGDSCHQIFTPKTQISGIFLSSRKQLSLFGIKSTRNLSTTLAQACIRDFIK